MKTIPLKSMTPVALLLAAACGGSQSGKVSIKLTDAPGDFKAAVVTITEIDLVGSGGVTVLSSATTTTNLLTLANDTADLVSNAVVEAGSYSELRFKISGGYVEVAQSGGGSIIYASSPTYSGLPAGAQVGGTLQMPSLAQSGLKVDLPGGNVTVGTDSKILLVDFNVQQSFGHVAGNANQWVMHPVMTAIDFGLSGNLDVAMSLASGATLPSPVTLANFNAVLTITNSDSTTSTKTLALAAGATAGSFGANFKYLIPGSNYSLGFQLDPSVTTAVTFHATPAVPFAVTIASGQATTASFTMSSP